MATMAPSSSPEQPAAEVLESGTSLAEEEHGGELAPVLPTTDTTAHSNEDGKNSRPTTIEAANGTEALRLAIANDILATGNSDEKTNEPSLFLFDSPFEVLPTTRSNKNGRYLQVPMVYCDQTASNRSLLSIENYMKTTCLPYYGNTHTNTSITGAQSTAFVAEARQIVGEATNARITGKASLDVVLFAGSGTTAAVELLIDCLGLKYACRNDGSSEGNSKNQGQPIVFVGPYEHHSNLVPWRESGCEIVTIPECPTNKTIDYEALEQLLQNPNYNNRLKMGTFTAASNVTGKVSDVDRIAATLHRHGALAFFDYATGAPYMSMDMNPSPSSQYPTPSLVAKDAIFLSPHKMVGGIGTPGVLVVKKHLINQENAPSRSGGGTVFYVTNTHHRFLSNRIDRYEGGTPNVPGILRVGLTFLFKRQVEQKYQALVSSSSSMQSNHVQNRIDREESVDREESNSMPRSLQAYEYSIHNRVAGYLKLHAPNLHLLGYEADNQLSPHLPIFSFLIKCGTRFLHFNYVCAILNDVFGIQSRGGCQCAGPYSQRLLGLTKISNEGKEVPNERNEAIEHALLHFKERAELLRPGYTRLSLPFKGLREEEVDYVLKALAWTAKNGWALMCNYRCNYRTGEWRHANRQGKPLGRSERKWLSHFTMNSAQSCNLSKEPFGGGDIRQVFGDALENADALLRNAKLDRQRIAEAVKMNDIDASSGADVLEQLRWYVHPKECALLLSKGMESVPGTDLPELEGGLNPLPSTKSPYTIPTFDGTLVDTAATNSPQTGDRKRKQTTVASPVVVETKKTKTTIAANEEKKTDWEPTVHPSQGILDAKNEKKKPSRGSATWAQGKFTLPETSAKASIHTEMNPISQKSGEHKSMAAEVAGKSQASAEKKKNKKNKFKHIRPPPKLMRSITQACIQFNMLEEGDRLLLGLSGGKDSLSLLHCLLECKRKLPINFEIEVCTIDPMTPSFDPSPLIPYVESLGLKYHYIRDNIVDRANAAGKDGKMVSSLCSFCARMKRGNLYTCARKNKCNKLVLAQHLDDCAESFLMSVMHNGFLRTMKAHYKIDAGDLSVIRPMVYCRESLMTNFAKSENLPVVNENCPACFEEPKERARTKKLLAREESLYPHFHDNIRRSLIPLMHDDMSSILRGYTEEAVSKSRKVPHNGKKSQRKGDVTSTVTPPTLDDEADGPNRITSDTSAPPTNNSLASFSEDQLMMELARRKASRYQKSAANGDSEDPTGQVCTLNGGNGSIPCRELME